MKYPPIPTKETLEKAEIYKALFCNLYFSELKLFLSDFNIVPNDKINSLNMGFLVAKYKNQNNCKWKIEGIKDEDLMLAIEEFYEITNQPFVIANDDEEDIPLYPEREKIVEYLFKNEENTQISLGDHTLHAILKYFNIPLSPNPKNGGMGGMATDFKNFSKLFPYPYNSFWLAVDLHSSLRNKKNHRFDSRFVGLQIHLYHRFVLYTYIGLVYICRRIWTTNECKKIWKDPNRDPLLANIQKPECISKFKMPPQDIIINVSSPDYPITKCKVQVGSGQNREVKDLKPNTPSIKTVFTASARKYNALKLQIFRDQVSDPFEKNLDYQSWFLSYDISLPKTLNCSSCGTEEEPTGKLLLELFGSLEAKDEEIRQIVKDEFSKIKDTWIASITDKDKQNRENIRSILQESLKELSDTFNKEEFKSSLNEELKKEFEEELQRRILVVQKNISTPLKMYQEKLDAFKKWTEDILQPLIRLDEKVSWIAYGIILFLVCIFPCYVLLDKFDANIFWLQYKWIPIIGTGIFSILSIFLFLSIIYKPGFLNKVINLKTYHWACVVLLPFLTFFAYQMIPYSSPDSLIKNYDFTTSGSHQKMADFMQEFMEDNIEYKEMVAIKLANYYFNIENNVEKAEEISSFMLDDIDKYKNGAMLAFSLLYKKCLLQDKEYYKVKDIIKKFGDIISNRPTTINWIEGHMYYYGKGHEQDPVRGESLIRDAADRSDSIAQYWEGRIRSYITPQWKTIEGSDTIFNIFKAIKYYRLSGLPEASLELGKLYADMNMNDSAKKYINNAISCARHSTLAEAYYRMGLLLGGGKNDYISKAMNKGYGPASVFAAKCDSDNQSIIDYYKSAGRYRGHKYIPPIVLAYAQNNNIYPALDTLNASHPRGNFNEEFVLAINSLIKGDSIKGMQNMKQSADKGCYYAKMICIYREMKKQIDQKGYSLGKIDSLQLFANRDSISFANILISDLYQDKGRYLESVKDIEAARDIYKKAEIAALEALRRGHPAGVIMLGDMRLGGFNFEYRHGRNKSFIALMKDQSWHHLMIRFSSGKYYAIAAGERVDSYLFSKENGHSNNENSPNWHFWSDLSICNHNFEEETWLLNETYNDDITYVKKLINACIEDAPLACDEKNKELIRYRIRVLESKKEYQKFIWALRDKYQNDPQRSDLFTEGDVGNVGDEVTLHFSFINHKTTFSNTSLLNECDSNSEIEDRIYDRPF